VERIIELPFVERVLLAAAYRNAAVLLMPSEAEGFGLPMIEAMACGTCVIASDIPVLREVGGDAAIYCPVGDLEAWKDAIVGAFQTRMPPHDRERVQRTILARAARFSWSENAAATALIYRTMLGTVEKSTSAVEEPRRQTEVST